MGWPLFDRIRQFVRRANLYRSDNLFQDQTDLSRFIFGNAFFNFRQTQSLIEQTNLQINRLERYKDYAQMDEVGEIYLALDLYADEASMQDPERKHVIAVRARSKRVKNELENLFFNILLIDNKLRPLLRYLCKYGDFAAEIVPTENRDAVASFRFMNIFNFTRVETKYGDLIGFFYQDEFAMQPVFLHPWQVMHLRLTNYENIFHPYGRSILDASRKTFKQLRLMEDAAIIYRLTRAPERRVFTIPVGHITPKEVPGYIQEIAATLKKRRIFDPASGEVNERWSPLIQEDDYFLPQRPDGTGPKVDTLPGAENLDQIADIEYFKKKMVSPLKIPFSRVGLGEGAGEDQQRQPLAAMVPEFAKAIQWIQREVAIGLKKIAIVHLSLKGYSIDEIRHFDIVLTSASAIDELYRMETWNSRVDVIGGLKETGMFPDEWILTSFTNLTEDEIMQMKEDMRKKGELPEVEETGLGGLEGELGGEAVEGEGAGGGAGGAGGGLPALEGFDSEAEEEMIQEYKDFTYRMDKLSTTPEEIESAVDHLLGANELSGLPQKVENEGVIVESNVPLTDELTVSDEIRSILMGKEDVEIEKRLEIIEELCKNGEGKDINTLMEEADALFKKAASSMQQDVEKVISEAQEPPGGDSPA